MQYALVALLALGCSGFIGERGLSQCVGFEARAISLDEPVDHLDQAVRDLPMFAASPARGTLAYEDGLSTGVSLRVEPVGAVLRTARNPVLEFDEARCEEVFTTYQVELFTDDGVLEFLGEASLVVEVAEDAAAVSVAVPYSANLGDAAATLAEWQDTFLDEHPDLLPESLVPVAYQLDLDLSDRAATGTVSLVMTHDPAPSVPRTVTEWVVGNF